MRPDGSPGTGDLCADALAVDPDTGHCYDRFQTSLADDAFTGCAERGGYLVVLDDPDEQALIMASFGVANVEAWIGLRRFEGSWRWSNDTPLSWTSWDSSSPSDEPGADCVKLDVAVGQCSAGCWKNRACIDDELLQAICEFEP